MPRLQPPHLTAAQIFRDATALQDIYRTLFDKYHQAHLSDLGVQPADAVDQAGSARPTNGTGGMDTEPDADAPSVRSDSPSDELTIAAPAKAASPTLPQPVLHMDEGAQKSRVDALLEAEVATIAHSIETQAVTTRTELLGRDRFGRGYYFFNTLPGVFVEPAKPVAASSAPDGAEDSAGELDRERIVLHASAFGQVDSDTPLPAFLVVCLAWLL